MYHYSSPTNCESERKRIIIFLDFDCYEVQVWLKILRQDLIGKDVPIVVVNRNQKILSVNYTAKNLGVQRSQLLNDARSVCHQKGENLIEIMAPDRYGKVDTFLPKTESDKILKCLQKFLVGFGLYVFTLERNGNDEFYIDATLPTQRRYFNSSCISPPALFKLSGSVKQNLNEKYFGKPTTIMETSEGKIFGQELTNRVETAEHRNSIYDIEELTLVHGALFAQALIINIKAETGYDVSAGVAHSKLGAKLACSRNKPEGITIISNSSHPRLQREINFQDLPGFGESTGLEIKQYYQNKRCASINTIHQLLMASDEGNDFRDAFDKLRIPLAQANKLYDFCHFQDGKEVVPVVHSNTFSTSMSFIDIESWKEFKDKIDLLSLDMSERIAYNDKEGRIAQELTVKVKMHDNVNVKVPRNLENKMKLTGKGPFHIKIYSHVRDYCLQLDYQDICNICLEAKIVL